MHLAQGDVALAAASIRDALDRPGNVPSKELPPNTELRRAPLLEAQVEIEIAAGNLDRARAAAEELARIAAVFESKALAAGATLARGQVDLAEGDAAGARREFAAAVASLGRGRRTLRDGTRPHGARGRVPRGGERGSRASWSSAPRTPAFEQIGAAFQAARAASPGEMPRDESARDGRRVHCGERCARDAENVFRREGDYWSVVFEGHTARLRDLKGLRYLARLLADPGRSSTSWIWSLRGCPCRDFPCRGAGLRFAMQAMPARCSIARQAAYRRRLTEIEEDLEEARHLGTLAGRAGEGRTRLPRTRAGPRGWTRRP